MTHRLALWSLAAYFFLIWFINLFAVFFHFQEFSWIWISHSIIINLLVPVSIYFIYRHLKHQDQESSNRKEILFLLASNLLFVIVMINKFPSHPLGLDEYVQQIMSLVNDPTLKSSVDHQPPGAYILTRVLGMIFGFKVLVARWTGLLPMAISLYFFLIVGGRISRFFPFGILFLTFYLVDPDVRYLALEGRPVGLGIASISALLLAIIEYIKRPAKEILLLIMVASYISLTSLGLQPLALLSLFAFINLIYFVFRKQKENRDLALVILAGGILYLPFQLHMLEVAKHLKKIQELNIERVLEKLSFFKFQDLLQYFTPESLRLLWIIFFILAVIISWIMARKSERGKWIHLGLCFFLLFPPIFHFSFITFINWFLNRWYFACFYVLSVALAAAAISAWKFKKLNWIITISFSLLLGTMTDTEMIYSKMISDRQDWKGLAQEIKKDEPQKIYLTGFCNKETWWCHTIFVGSLIWWDGDYSSFRGIYSKIVLRGYLQDNGMMYDSYVHDEKTQITVVILAEKNIKELAAITQSKSDAYSVRTFKNFVIIETKEPVIVKEEVPKLLTWLIDHSKPEAMSFYPYMLLIWHYHNIGQIDLAQKWYQKLEKLSGFLELAKESPMGNAILNDIKKLAYPIWAKKKEDKLK